jgi:hypothetical protein
MRSLHGCLLYYSFKCSIYLKFTNEKTKKVDKKASGHLLYNTATNIQLN